MLGKDITAGRSDFSFMGVRGSDINHTSSLGDALNIGVPSKKNKGGDMSIFGTGGTVSGGKGMMDSQSFLNPTIPGGQGTNSRKRDR